jgi:multiple antibiotic resistance protein
MELSGVQLLQALVLVPATLLPIINPLSTAPVFAATVGTNTALSEKLARQIAINGWYVIVGSILVGSYVLDLFGISLPVVRIGGGLLVAATAWRLLNSSGGDEVKDAAAEHAASLSQAEVVRRSFFPLTFPLTTGPGTIAAAIALGAQIPPRPAAYLAGAIVGALGAFVVSVVLYLILKNSVAVLAKLGEVGMLVMTRLMAFILLCIGIQIMWTGWAELNGIPR